MLLAAMKAAYGALMAHKVLGFWAAYALLSVKIVLLVVFGAENLAPLAKRCADNVARKPLDLPGFLAGNWLIITLTCLGGANDMGLAALMGAMAPIVLA